jgi:hypothetical protein
VGGYRRRGRGQILGTSDRRLVRLQRSNLRLLLREEIRLSLLPSNSLSVLPRLVSPNDERDSHRNERDIDGDTSEIDGVDD